MDVDELKKEGVHSVNKLINQVDFLNQESTLVIMNLLFLSRMPTQPFLRTLRNPKIHSAKMCSTL